MAERRKCKHCHQNFSPRPQNPDQQYCSERACQRARKRIWQNRKLLADPDYHANQSAAQSSWQERNSDYWSKYREKHPDYVERNREHQRERNLRRRGQDTSLLPIAKMDASMPESAINSGRYLLSRVADGRIAKMDALIVEINVVSGG
jgi:hypothetical protein